MHGRFYLSDVPIAVGIVGPGLIGSTLIKQIQDQARMLHDSLGIDLRVVGVASSKKMLLDERGIDLSKWRETFDSDGVPCDLSEFGNYLNRSYIPNSLVVDTTASGERPRCSFCSQITAVLRCLHSFPLRFHLIISLILLLPAPSALWLHPCLMQLWLLPSSGMT